VEAVFAKMDTLVLERIAKIMSYIKTTAGVCVCRERAFVLPLDCSQVCLAHEHACRCVSMRVYACGRGSVRHALGYTRTRKVKRELLDRAHIPAPSSPTPAHTK